MLRTNATDPIHFDRFRIRAHAVKVEEFVTRGLAAYKEETPLPEDYTETRP